MYLIHEVPKTCKADDIFDQFLVFFKYICHRVFNYESSVCIFHAMKLNAAYMEHCSLVPEVLLMNKYVHANGKGIEHTEPVPSNPINYRTVCICDI